MKWTNIALYHFYSNDDTNKNKMPVYVVLNLTNSWLKSLLWMGILQPVENITPGTSAHQTCCGRGREFRESSSNCCLRNGCLSWKAFIRHVWEGLRKHFCQIRDVDMIVLSFRFSFSHLEVIRYNIFTWFEFEFVLIHLSVNVTLSLLWEGFLKEYYEGPLCPLTSAKILPFYEF